MPRKKNSIKFNKYHTSCPVLVLLEAPFIQSKMSGKSSQVVFQRSSTNPAFVDVDLDGGNVTD